MQVESITSYVFACLLGDMMSGFIKSEENQKFGLFDARQSILVLDGLLMKCDICENTFVPQENLSFDDLIHSLKTRLLNPESPPSYPQIDKVSRKKSACENTNMHYKVFYKNRLRSDDENTSDDDITHGVYAPIKQRRSSTGIPNSVLLQITPSKSSLQDSISEEDEVFVDNRLDKLRERFMDQINWVKDKGKDYIALETLGNIDEIISLLKIFLEEKTPAALGFKINQNQTITISYQFLNDFDKDFMMLKVGDNYRVFISPF